MTEGNTGPVTDIEELNATPSMTFQEIYKELCIQEDIYLVSVKRADIDKLKKGLSNIKAKDNAKAKIADLPVLEDRRIEYEIIELTDKYYNPAYVKVHIFFKEPVGIPCKLIEADGEL